MSLKSMDIRATSSSNSLNDIQNEKTRIKTFHIRVISKYTKIYEIFDSGSQENLMLEDIVKKLNLETIPHSKHYPLGWVCENEELQVTRKCIPEFSITAEFLDQVELDVVLIDICVIILGSSYIYDRREIFHRHENKYHLFKNGIEYISRAHSKKLILSFVNVGKMKKIVNASKIFALLMFKHKPVEAYKGLQEYE